MIADENRIPKLKLYREFHHSITTKVYQNSLKQIEKISTNNNYK